MLDIFETQEIEYGSGPKPISNDLFFFGYNV